MEYKLVSNGVNESLFNGYLCHWNTFPTSIWSDPSQSLTVSESETAQIVFQTATYVISNSPAECIVSYDLEGPT